MSLTSRNSQKASLKTTHTHALMRCSPSAPLLSLLLSRSGAGGKGARLQLKLHSGGRCQGLFPDGAARRRGLAAGLPRTLPLGLRPLRQAPLTGHYLLRFPHAEGAPGNPRLGRENGGGGSVGPKVVSQPRLGPWKPLGLP